MPRFSVKAKNIHDQIWYYTNIITAKSIMKELKDPLEIAFGKLFIADYYISFRQIDEFLEILNDLENVNEQINDQFIQFLINYNYCFYYLRDADPIVGKEQVERYLQSMEKSYQNIDYKDDWEKYYCIELYYFAKALYEAKFNNNLPNAIKFHKLRIESALGIPEDGEYISALGYNNLGVCYLDIGELDEAEKSFHRMLDACEKYRNLWQFHPLGNLAWLKSVKGDFKEAMELNEQGLEIAKQFDNAYAISGRLGSKGNHLYLEGNYDESLKIYQEALDYAKLHGNPLSVFEGHYDIFTYYYSRFRVTSEDGYLKGAQEKLNDLRELSESYSENKTIVNYYKYAQALIFKHGNVRKRAKAIDTLEELLGQYVENISREIFILSLLELLFEDMLISDDRETIDQIDELMENLINIPLRNNPKAVLSFTGQQIILAKYHYYIKGDPNLALTMLNDAKNSIATYKLNNLVLELEKEIKVLEIEFTKWDGLDKSVKERIKASKFNNYIEEALNMVNKQI